MDKKQVIRKLVDWGKGKEDIRALILTSSLTNPQTETDEFTDYDVIVVAKDIKPYLKDESWLGEFGKVLALYREPE